jgi:hypothetical protein
MIAPPFLHLGKKVNFPRILRKECLYFFLRFLNIFSGKKLLFPKSKDATPPTSHPLRERSQTHTRESEREMGATRKKAAPDEPESVTTDSADATDSDAVDDTRNQQTRSGLSPLSVPRTSTSSADLDNVRVWPLCFAIAIEKSRNVRPAIMFGGSSLLAGVTYHLQESDSEMMVRVVCLYSFLFSSRDDKREREPDFLRYSPPPPILLLQPNALILSPLVVFILIEAATLCAAFFILLPQTMAQAYRDDKNTKFKVADSAVLSALPPAVARFAVGSGIAWQRVVLAVLRDGALFLTVYLLCVAALVGGEDDADLAELENAKGIGINGEEGNYLEGGEGGGGAGGGAGVGGWQEMDGGISVRNLGRQ